MLCLGQALTLFSTETSKIVFAVQDSEAENHTPSCATSPRVVQVRENSPGNTGMLARRGTFLG